MNSPAVLFRCDAGKDHGLGHVMRCLSLAEEFRRQKDVESEFLMNAPERLIRRVKDAGFSASKICTDAGTALDCPHISKWTQNRSISDQVKPWVIIDGKYADPEAIKMLAHSCRLICFDDSQYRDFPCEVIVNSQPWVTENDYPKRIGRRILAGGEFNSIHQDYFNAAMRIDRECVLITLGGEDPFNHTAWVARAFGDLLANYPVLTVIGPAHPNSDEAISEVKYHLPHTEVYLGPPSLTSLAERSFLAISAGGTSCCELQAAEIAVAAIAVEEHQISYVKHLERLGGVVSLAGPKCTSAHSAGARDRELLSRLLKDDTWRKERIARGKALFPTTGGALLVKSLAEVLQ